MTPLANAAPLSQLKTLDRRLLHVFVAGPGYGEGIAVACPHAGWVIIDGCQIADETLPLLEILSRWRIDGEPIDCVGLTHAHRDHAAGVRRLIEETLPRRVGLSAPPKNPERVFASVDDPRKARATADRQRLSHALDALRTIRRYWTEHPESRLCLVDGVSIPTTSRAVDMRVCSPLADHLEAAIERAATGGLLIDKPNEISAAIELSFGATRVVLGSDLPAVAYDGTLIRGGWGDVVSRHSMLGQHAGLKLPHHGSRYAFHSELHTAGSDRAWWLTPFNQGQRLPPLGDDGLGKLVAHNRRVLITALPRSREAQAVHDPPAVFLYADVPALFSPAVSAGPGAIASSPPIVEALDPVWCIAFDDANCIAGAWRGRCAFSVVST